MHLGLTQMAPIPPDACHMLLDLFISLSPLTSTSPSSPAESASTVRARTDFTQIKIRLREMESAEVSSRPPKRLRVTGAETEGEKTDFLGRDDVTVRFLFEPGR
jgi:hypothetical protein